MNAVSFMNKGLIDVRAISTFGVSSKETESPIGHFGTGIKYAIAIALRLGCGVTIWRGMEAYEFDTLPVKIRVDEFKIVRMNGAELGFTTELGKDWEPWQAFREFWCNAIDEGGDVIDGVARPEDGNTIVIVRGDALASLYDARDQIMLRGEPTWRSPNGVEIHDRPSTSLFYRGVRAHDLNRPARYTYNIVRPTLVLTEDRTVKYSYETAYHLRQAITGSSSVDLIKGAITAPRGSMELDLTYEIDSDWGDTFLDTVRDLPWAEITSQHAVRAYKAATRKGRAPRTVILTPTEVSMLAEARRVCLKLDLPADAHDVFVSDEMPDDVMGMVLEKEKIFISRRTFLRGQDQVTGTLIEELIHRCHGLEDESRGMQNYLIDLLVSRVRN